MALIGYIEQLHWVGLKNRFLQRQIVTFQDNMSTKEEDNFSRSFRNAVHHALRAKQKFFFKILINYSLKGLARFSNQSK